LELTNRQLTLAEFVRLRNNPTNVSWWMLSSNLHPEPNEMENPTNVSWWIIHSQKNDRIVFVAAGCRGAMNRRDRDLVVIERTWFAVDAQSLPTVLTVVTTKRQTELPQRFKQRQQQPSTLRQTILNMRRVSTEIDPLDEIVVLHVTQPPNKRPAADRKQTVKQLHRPLWTSHQLAHHEHRPFIAEYLQRPGYWTAIEFASLHL
jgi:hypothetical protein